MWVYRKFTAKPDSESVLNIGLTHSLPSCWQHLSNDDCLEDKSEDYQNCSVLYCVLLYTVIRPHVWTVFKADCWFRFSLDLGFVTSVRFFYDDEFIYIYVQRRSAFRYNSVIILSSHVLTAPRSKQHVRSARLPHILCLCSLSSWLSVATPVTWQFGGSMECETQQMMERCLYI